MNKFGIKVLALMLCASAFALNAQSQASILESYLVTDSGAGNDYKTAATADGYYFGFFRTGNTFLLKGAEIQSTSDDATGNVCSGTLHYRIYKECETPGSFLTVALPFCCDEGGTDCDGGACNVPASGAGITNQKWRSNTETINILSGLTKGDYILEFYTSATGSTTSNADCSETLLFDNSSSNFKGQFSVGEEGFADGNFSANPTWTGNTGSFSVIDPTTLSGSGSNVNINGSGVDNPTVLVSNLGVTDAALVKASSQAYGVWEFSVATGSGWSPSDANNAMIVLTSDTNDPTKLIIDSGTGAPDFNGYAIKFGQDGSLDSFRLVKQTGTLSEEILDTGYPAAANFFSGYTVRVVRSTNGEFSIYIDPGFDNTDASTLRGEIRDVDHPTSSYMAVVINANNAGAARRLYFDNLMMGAATELSFDVATAPVTETDADFTYYLTVDISNPDDRCASSADVVLVSGDASRIGSYTTQSISFPAGSSTSVTVPVTISGNTSCERNENLVFELQNLGGGCSALATGNSSTTIQLDDDESGTETDVSDDFEDNDISNWINTTNWALVNSTATISGTYDVRHTNTVASNDYISFNMCSMPLRGVETQWRWNMKHGGFETSTNNWLMFVFSANQPNIWNGTANNSPMDSNLDGYAIGVNFGTATDNLRLVRIDNGVATDLASSSYDWNLNVVLGIEVVRDEDGLFEFKYQENGGFDAMTSGGTATDVTYVTMDYMAFATNLTVGNVNKCRIDDIQVEQYGCFETWYTTGTGNASAAIWSQVDTDISGSVLNFGRFKNLVVQDTHTMTLDTEVVCHDFELESTGSADGTGNSLVVNRGFINNGSWTSGTGEVVFKPYSTSTISGSTTTEFNTLRIEGSGQTLVDTDTDLRGVLYPNKGDFDTFGSVFRLISDGSGTASIAEIKADATFTGDVRLERHIPTGSQTWFNLGNPLTGVDINQWDDDIVTTGFTGSQWPSYNWNNIRGYNETTAGDLDQGFEGAADVNDLLSTDKGYLVYLDGSSYDVSVDGGIQQGDISQSIDYTSNVGLGDDGWNLVVNRYPSAIDWNALYANSTGIGSTYYIHDGDGFSGTRNYIYKDAVSGTGTASQYIASSQSFWVKVDAAGGTLEWTEDIKAQVSDPFERALMVLPQIGFKLVGETSADHTYVVLDNDLSTNYDSGRDAFHIGGGDMNIDEDDLPTIVGLSTLTNDEYKVSVNNIPFDLAISVPVRISVYIPQTVTFSVSNFTEIPESMCLILEDLVTGEFYTVNEDLDIQIAISEAYAGVRFMLHMTPPAEIAVNNISCYGMEDGSVSAQGFGAGPFDYTWYDEMDNVIFTETSFGESMITDLPLGNYIVEIHNVNAMCETVYEMVSIDQPQQESGNLSFESDICESGLGWIGVNVNHISNYSFDLYDADGNLLLSESDVNGFSLIEDLTGGIYNVHVNTGCSAFELVADVSDPNAVEASILVESVEVAMLDGEAIVEFVSSTTNASTLLWLVDGVEQSADAVFNFVFTEVGTHNVVLMASNEFCETSATLEIIVQSEANFIDNSSVVSITLAYVQDGVQLSLANLNGNGQLKVSNALGQTVDSIRLASGTEQYFMSTAGYSAGVYNLELVVEGERAFVAQFVK